MGWGPEAPPTIPWKAHQAFPDQPRGFFGGLRVASIAARDQNPRRSRNLTQDRCLFERFLRNDSAAGSLGARRQDIYISVQRSGEGSLVTTFTIANTKGDVERGKPRSRIGAKGSGRARLLTTVRGGHCRILRVRYARSQRAS